MIEHQTTSLLTVGRNCVERCSLCLRQGPTSREASRDCPNKTRPLGCLLAFATPTMDCTLRHIAYRRSLKVRIPDASKRDQPRSEQRHPYRVTPGMGLDDPGLQFGRHEGQSRHGLVLTWLCLASPLRCHRITNPFQGSMLAEPTDLVQECGQVNEVNICETLCSAPDKLELIQLGHCPNNILNRSGLCLLSLLSRKLSQKATPLNPLLICGPLPA